MDYNITLADIEDIEANPRPIPPNGKVLKRTTEIVDEHIKNTVLSNIIEYKGRRFQKHSVLKEQFVIVETIIELLKSEEIDGRSTEE